MRRSPTVRRRVRFRVGQGSRVDTRLQSGGLDGVHPADDPNRFGGALRASGIDLNQPRLVFSSGENPRTRDDRKRRVAWKARVAERQPAEVEARPARARPRSARARSGRTVPTWPAGACRPDGDRSSCSICSRRKRSPGVSACASSPSTPPDPVEALSEPVVLSLYGHDLERSARHGAARDPSLDHHRRHRPRRRSPRPRRRRQAADAAARRVVRVHLGLPAPRPPFGVMEGTYQMISTNGESFDARIAPFTLSEPYTVH